MFSGNLNFTWKWPKKPVIFWLKVSRCFCPCQSSIDTFVLTIGLCTAISIRVYVLNKLCGCIFSEWRKSAATNRSSVEIEAERETLTFLLLVYWQLEQKNTYKLINWDFIIFLSDQTLSGKRIMKSSSSVTLPFSSSNSGWIVRRPVRSLGFTCDGADEELTLRIERNALTRSTSRIAA